MSNHRRHEDIRSSWIASRDDDDCISPDPANTLTDRLNIALNSSGAGYVLSLCPGKQYLIESPIYFFANDQEISTSGYPTGDDRAILTVNGVVQNGVGHTTAVDGTCSNCTGVKLRNIQIDGARNGAAPTTSASGGGANIEMGGSNTGQLIEYVRSYDSRSWSCLHVVEGALSCSNVTVQNNDIGPCGSDAFQEWADGISVSCQDSIVRNNMIENPTDGGIVLFGSPGTQVYNNTIWVVNQTLLGGINMVDYLPWSGNYTGTQVYNNTIYGGFATDSDSDGATDGTNQDDAIMKIGIAIGPRTWFGDQFGTNVSSNGTIFNNQLSGAFSYGIAITSASNFTIQDNVLFGNTSFIGARGPNCTAEDTTPSPAAFIVDPNNTESLTLQSSFQTVSDGASLTCVLPPDGGDYWPYGGNPDSSSSGSSGGSSGSSGSSGLSGGAKAGIAIGVIVGVAVIALSSWLLRKWAVKRADERRHFNAVRRASSYTRQI